MTKEFNNDFLIQMVATYISEKAKPEQREASYLLMCHYMGKKRVRFLIDELSEVKSRDDYKVKKWSKEVREKYNHKCANCGDNRKTHAHHIWSWSRHPMDRVNIDNGILLCVNCHSLEHPEIANLIKNGSE